MNNTANIINFVVNGKKYVAPAGLTVIQALDLNKIQVPRFCYNDDLSIAGNCRMCLIEMKNSLKPVASCAINIAENMVLFTKTKFVKKAREDVLEFLLINHPLDCPICDQGGECDLQDISYNYGTDRGRFFEKKRSVTNKFSGPLIKMIMTRCIHCTRCTRFFEEHVGKPFFGMLNRGSTMEIDTYINNIVDSEISGNVIDLCPVGALTSKPSAFVGRPWEFENAISIDIFDSFGAEIRIDFKTVNKIFRILPNINPKNHFITDKIRFIFDVFNYTRLEFPSVLSATRNTYLRRDFSFVKYTLIYFINELKYKIFSLGKFIDYGILVNLKISNKFLKFNILNDLFSISSNKQIPDFIKQADNLLFADILHLITHNCLKKIILVNSNLRLEMPLLNLKIREYTINTNDWVIYFGDIKSSYINYKFIHGSNSVRALFSFLFGKSWVCNTFIVDRLYISINPQKNNFDKINYILLGINTLFDKTISKLINYYILNINPKLNTLTFSNFTKVSYLYSDITLINSKFINLTAPVIFNNFKEISHKSLLYGINLDIINYTTFYNNKAAYSVYQGFFLENISAYLYNKKIDLILPTKNWLEYSGKTLTFNGEFINFSKVYEKSKFLKRPDFYVLSLLQHYIINVKNLDININKMIINNVDYFFNKLFFENSIYFFYWIKYKYIEKINFSNFFYINKIYLYKKENKLFFNFNKINPFFINPFNGFYKNDILSKISTTLTICSNFIKKLDNF